MKHDVNNEIKSFLDETPEVQVNQPRQAEEEPSTPQPTSFIRSLLSETHLVNATGDFGDLEAGYFIQFPRHAGTVYPINSEYTRKKLQSKHFEMEGIITEKPISKNKMEEYVNLFEAHANKSGEKSFVAYRNYYDAAEESILIDLGNKNHERIKITRQQNGSYRVVKGGKVYFVRKPQMKSLITPEDVNEREGYEAFKALMPPSMTDAEVKLMIGSMVGLMVPSNFQGDVMYPVIFLKGAPGSGKSTLTKLIKLMVDNTNAIGCTMVKKPQDLFILAQNNRVVTFDNISGINDETSDAICQITGGGDFATRKLYSNDGMHAMKAHGGFLLNTVSYLPHRQDLIDRSLVFNLKRIENYDPSTTFQNQKRLAAAYGYLLTIFAKAFANYKPEAPTQSKSRLAFLSDFLQGAEPFGASAESFTELLERNQQNTLRGSEEFNPLMTAFVQLVKEHPKWQGTFKELLHKLGGFVSYDERTSSDWVKTPKALSSFMANHQLIMESYKVKFEVGSKWGNGRQVTVYQA